MSSEPATAGRDIERPKRVLRLVVAVGVAYHPLETLNARAQTLDQLSAIFTEVGSDHALIGGIAVGYHARPRATVDVGFLVPRAKLDALAVALQQRGFIVVQTRDMVRVYPTDADPDDSESIADLVAQEATQVLEAAARLAEPARTCSDTASASCRAGHSSR